MNLFANMRMRNKLILLLILPLVGMLDFSANELWDKLTILREVNHMKALSAIAIETNGLIHELQKERGMSAGFMGNQGRFFRKDLRVQRSATDKEMKELATLVGGLKANGFDENLLVPLENALSDLKELANKRDLVNSLKISLDEELRYYTHVIDELFEFIPHLSANLSDVGLSTMVSAYVNLLQAKEQAGLERAVLNNTFARDEFSAGMFDRFTSLVAAQDVYTNVFFTFATPEQIAFYKRMLSGRVVDEVARMRKVAYARAGEGHFGIQPASWWEKQTDKINLMKRVEDKLSNDIRAKSDKLDKESHSLFIFYLTMTIALVLGSAVLAFSITRSITRPLHIAVGVANQLSEGDTSLNIDNVNSKDETGQLLTAMANMVASINSTTTAAAKIAAGDLMVKVVPRSKKDVFGNALADMVRSLRQQARDIIEGVNVLADSTNEISASMTQVASGAAETATAVSETATTMEEVKQTAQISSEKAEQVSQVAQEAVQVSRAGEAAVNETVQEMSRIRKEMESVADCIVKLSEQNQAIGEIIASVNDLAEQSNLLAVNASIEAAKAGEQGKGFAVVAQEIKSLADQSKQATAQVRTLLGDIQKATDAAVMATEQGSKAVEAGVKQSRDAGRSIRRLAAAVEESSDVVSQIAASIREQLVGVDQVTVATENIRVASSQNVESMNQMERSTQNLHELGQRLKQVVVHYRV